MILLKWIRPCRFDQALSLFHPDTNLQSSKKTKNPRGSVMILSQWCMYVCMSYVRPGSWKNDFFLAAPKRSKLWGNDIYLYLRLFAKYGAKRTRQKKFIRVQSCDFGILAGEIGTRTLCRPKKTWRSRNEDTGMVAIESQHENRSDSMYYNGNYR